EQALAAEKDNAGRATDLGLFLKETGNLNDAIAPLRKALEINRAAGGVEVSRSEERLGQALASAGKTAEPAELCRRAATSGAQRVVAQSYAALAKLEPARADAHYARAIHAEEAASGRDHPRVAVLLSNQALVRQEKQDFRAAEELLRRALA